MRARGGKANGIRPRDRARPTTRSSRRQDHLRDGHLEAQHLSRRTSNSERNPSIDAHNTQPILDHASHTLQDGGPAALQYAPILN
jgi:hypothetical protein